jgi:DnaK suppressor protein
MAVQTPTPDTMKEPMAALTDTDLRELEHELVALRSSLSEELAEATETARPVGLDQPIGRLTRMDAIQQQNMALAHRDRLQSRLERVTSALARIAAGTYGECLRCGDEIEPRRLRIQPEATLCRDCQQG